MTIRETKEKANTALQRKIDDALTKEVFAEVQDEEAATIYEEIYKTYTPKGESPMDTKYKTTEHRAFVGAKEILVRDLIPIFKDSDEKRKRKREIESGLYQIFAKYAVT